jgi:XTP/dITP diphosphohydrolase
LPSSSRAPRRRLAGDGRLLVATHNRGKLREFEALLRPFGIAVVPPADLGLPEPPETGTTFEENARLKAVAAARASGLPALADDSGLVAYGLDGAPGVYSADWAGPGGDFSPAIRRVLDKLAARYGSWEATDRRAAFVSTLCLAWPDGGESFHEGRVEGELVPEPRGTRGFGYDPIFVPEGHRLTFGEMDPAEKDLISHRARAFAAFAAAELGA